MQGGRSCRGWIAAWTAAIVVGGLAASAGHAGSWVESATLRSASLTGGALDANRLHLQDADGDGQLDLFVQRVQDGRGTATRNRDSTRFDFEQSRFGSRAQEIALCRRGSKRRRTRSRHPSGPDGVARKLAVFGAIAASHRRQYEQHDPGHHRVPGAAPDNLP